MKVTVSLIARTTMVDINQESDHRIARHEKPIRRSVVIPEFFANVKLTITQHDADSINGGGVSQNVKEISESLKRINKAVKAEVEGPLFNHLQTISVD